MAIRQTILAAAAQQPRLLETGAGIGRIGWSFVIAGDNYVGSILIGQVASFQAADRGGRPTARLIQADGARLPFPEATFDAVFLMQIFGGLDGWKDIVAETCRVLRPEGIVIMGRTIAPANGLGARMKQRLAIELRKVGAQSGIENVCDDVQRWFESNTKQHARHSRGLGD